MKKIKFDFKSETITCKVRSLPVHFHIDPILFEEPLISFGFTDEPYGETVKQKTKRIINEILFGYDKRNNRLSFLRLKAFIRQ